MKTLLLSDKLGLAVAKEFNIDTSEHMLTRVNINAECSDLVSMTLTFDLTIEQYKRIAESL